MPEPQPPKWHPLQSVREPDPGHWELYDQFGKKYADIAIVRRAGELGYRCLVLRPHAAAPAELEFSDTLRTATERVHGHWVAGHSGGRDREWELVQAEARRLPAGAPGATRSA